MFYLLRKKLDSKAAKPSLKGLCVYRTSESSSPEMAREPNAEADLNKPDVVLVDSTAFGNLALYDEAS